MRALKNLLIAVGISGIFSASSFKAKGQNNYFQRGIDVNTDSLEKYTNKNSKVYQDFEKFIKEKGSQNKNGSKYVSNKDAKIEYFSDNSQENSEIVVSFNKRRHLPQVIYDRGCNGIMPGQKDFVKINEAWINPSKVEDWKTQVEIARGYTELLIQIMREKNYNSQ